MVSHFKRRNSYSSIPVVYLFSFCLFHFLFILNFLCLNLRLHRFSVISLASLIYHSLNKSFHKFASLFHHYYNYNKQKYKFVIKCWVSIIRYFVKLNRRFIVGEVSFQTPAFIHVLCEVYSIFNYLIFKFFPDSTKKGLNSEALIIK